MFSNNYLKRISGNYARQGSKSEAVHEDQYPPGELDACGTELQNPGRQGLSVVEGRRCVKLLGRDELTGDAGGLVELAGRHDDPEARVTTTTHDASPGVHHETHQESVWCIVVVCQLQWRTREYKPKK